MDWPINCYNMYPVDRNIIKIISTLLILREMYSAEWGYKEDLCLVKYVNPQKFIVPTKFNCFGQPQN